MKKAIAPILVICCCIVLSACQKPCEHQYQKEVTTEASCSAVGVLTYTCSLCEESYTEEIPMISHSYESEVTQESTCAEEGVNTFTCTACQDTYTESLPLTEHTWGEEFISKDPTCTEEGEYSVSCTLCSTEKITGTIAVIDHTYIDVVTIEATCTSEGELTPTCECGATQASSAIPMLNHNYTWMITKEATYKQHGTKEYTCTGCGRSYTETIAKLSPAEITSYLNDGLEHINTSLGYMSSALKYYSKGSDTSGRNVTSYMLIEVGLAIVDLKYARDLCGDHPDLSEIKSNLTLMINELEYVKKYDSISTSNYYRIVMDIYNKNVFQNAVNDAKTILYKLVELG